MQPPELPDTGSSGLTYDGVVDVGVFDGRVYSKPTTKPAPAKGQAARTTTTAAKSKTKAAKKASSAKPAKPKTPAKSSRPGHAKPATAVATSDDEPKRKSHRVPFIAGIVFVVVGAIGAGYGVYQLVITNFIAAEAQEDLSSRFEERQALASAGDLDEAFVYTETSAVPGADESGFGSGNDVPVIFVDTDTPFDPTPLALRQMDNWHPETAPPHGDAVGRIVIPQAGIDWVIVEGVNVGDLRRGPGHMPGTSMPGQYGNAVISGHRTTYGGPFGNIDDLKPGDQFTVETLIGVHTYEVVSTSIVLPRHTWVVQQREGSWLTLTSCYPKYSSERRLIVFSRLVDGPNIDAITTYYGTTYEPPQPPIGTSRVPPLPTTTTLPTSDTTVTTEPTTTTTAPTTTTTEGTTTTTEEPTTTTTTP